MNNSRYKKVDQIKLNPKGDMSQINSKEFDKEDLEVMEILNQNSTPDEKHEINTQFEIPMPALIIPETKKGRSGTISPFKARDKSKSTKKPELEFAWRNITVTAKFDKGCCSKPDPLVDKDKVIFLFKIDIVK